MSVGEMNIFSVQEEGSMESNCSTESDDEKKVRNEDNDENSNNKSKKMKPSPHRPR
jgi:hypothetical protein